MGPQVNTVHPAVPGRAREAQRFTTKVRRRFGDRVRAAARRAGGGHARTRRATRTRSPGTTARPRLDDEADRPELRRRYYGLLQELRVLLPGVQVLVAFLLTRRCVRLRQAGRPRSAPTVALLKRHAGDRLLRRADRSTASAAPVEQKRLVWSIRMMRAGLVFMALAFETALFVVLGELFSQWVSVSVHRPRRCGRARRLGRAPRGRVASTPRPESRRRTADHAGPALRGCRVITT